MFGGIRRLLDAQAERLSPVERDVLMRMAVEREPVSLAELSRAMLPSAASDDGSSRQSRRYGDGHWWSEANAERRFTLQSMVLEYVTDRLVETVADEIERGAARACCVEQPLIKAQAKDYVRQTQERLIGAPILQRLQSREYEMQEQSDDCSRCSTAGVVGRRRSRAMGRATWSTCCGCWGRLRARTSRTSPFARPICKG